MHYHQSNKAYSAVFRIVQVSQEQIQFFILQLFRTLAVPNNDMTLNVILYWLIVDCEVNVRPFHLLDAFVEVRPSNVTGATS